MPRDINGVYTLPAPMPVQPRTIPVTNVFNTVLADVKDALNNIPGDALAPGSVDTAQLADGAVTNAKTSFTTALKIVGNGTGPLDGTSWLGFYQADGTTRWGYIGNPANSVDYIEVAAEVGRLRLAGSVSNPMVELPRGQLQFPATQNPSTDPNTLDDYEEGTFTPTITFSTPGNLSVTYETQAGRYTKIGDLVTFSLRVRALTFTHTTAAGVARITGLPFVVQSGNPHFPCCIGYAVGMSALANEQLMALAVPATSYIDLYRSTGATSTTASPATIPTGGTKDLIISGSYKV